MVDTLPEAPDPSVSEVASSLAKNSSTKQVEPGTLTLGEDVLNRSGIADTLDVIVTELMHEQGTSSRPHQQHPRETRWT